MSGAEREKVIHGIGVSALSDIISEVDTIQSCGGQKTVDGSRFRTRGGVLWSIIKVREPNAYKEIMKKAKEFEDPSVFSVKTLYIFVFLVLNKTVKFVLVLDVYVPIIWDSKKQPPFSQPNVKQPPLQKKEDSSQEESSTFGCRLRIPISYDDDLLELSMHNNPTFIPLSF
ncbi:hypothetical protein PHAVU_001G033700 [Phaseolus vulgaris]|uniref:Phosphorylated adapter RNA export protein n=1 Tax=Phaseolus vulgaris TaxID=3885 RepID=V7CUB9_PHAVU|nr:hypothetical protein PHAVU_001G033700g [Phaseolus vulgaris]ESW32983.1 hypothetical protein PHAVU_001G033700g [Phaseolus vulgaris]